MSMMKLNLNALIATTLLAGLGISTNVAIASDPPPVVSLEALKRDAVPHVVPASTEAQSALKRFRLPSGFEASVFAAEPMLANPVAFCLDEKGRVFVAETHRFGTSVLDIRHYMGMLDDDLACRSVEDRLAMTKKNFGEEAKQLALEPEIIRLIQDRNHDGKADVSSIYADGFNSALDGIASGVLAHRGKLWFANIPEITELQGIDTQGQAKSRQTFSYGYGVRFSYTGHDLHGLILGPDGKLYFSFGDRGANVKTKEGKTLSFPDEGAVFRCNPDGSDLEVVHRGLRNPQELAFDEFGNLFTGDNDFDHGDHERWVYVVEGGDSGWRVGYQHPPLGYDLVPWMAEKLWVPHFDGQAAYIVPPIANLDDGPSGLVYYPGTGLPAKYHGHFFLCQFKGTVAKSGIQTFSVKPSGASFELVKSEPFLWNVQATDVDFGPDSRLYFSDWGEGWAQTGKGRIYRVSETNSIKDPIVRETEKIIGKGFVKSSQRELLKFLSHPNMRVRIEAQFTLAERGPQSVEALAKLSADNSSNPVARRHAIWALGQLGRKNSAALDSLIPLLRSHDPEIRAQTAKMVGDGRKSDAFVELVKLLNDPSLRVRFFAAQSLGKLERGDAVEPLLAMLRENNNRDVYLRHGGAFALSRCATVPQLVVVGKDGSSAVRMGALLAMRYLEVSDIAMFLEDADELLVVEAARAINDVPINSALPQLAALLSPERKFGQNHASQFEAFQLRAVNANFHLGAVEHANALAQYAARQSSLTSVAEEALNVFAIWDRPGQRDRIVGTYRQFPGNRNGEVAATALRPVVNQIVSGDRPDPIKLAAINAIIGLRLTSAGQSLYAIFAGNKNSEKVRIEALKALAELKDSRLTDAAKLAQTDSSELVRREGNRLVTQFEPETAVAQIRSILENGSVPEQQGAMVSLASITNARADSIVSEQVEKYLAGKLPREIELELFEVASKRPSLNEKLHKQVSKSSESLDNFRQTLFGGDAKSGRKIFLERPEASCMRCHKIGSEGGDVGPALTTIGAEKTREYLLQSMVQPNAQIAPGFETLLVVTRTGASYAGIFKSENETELAVNSPEDGLVKIAKADIKSRERGNSGMPDGLTQILSKREIRDLVEFLATLK
ncbi:MAG: HEAT repeat domain-containing protein [Verrucomicrobiota bacterium]